MSCVYLLVAVRCILVGRGRFVRTLQLDVALRHLLESLADTQLDPSTRKKVCDVVGELGVSIMDEGQWPQLLPFMFDTVNSADPLQVGVVVLAIFALS